MPDEILEKALKLLDEGKSPAEIFNIFQDNQKELEEIFNLLGKLKIESKKINLPEGLKSKIKTSLLNYKEEKPELTFIEKIQAKLKFIIPVMAVTAIMLFLLIPKNDQPDSLADTTTKTTALNQTTDHIDETANKIITDFTNDNPYSTASEEEINSIQKSYSEYNINDVYNEETF